MTIVQGIISIVGLFITLAYLFSSMVRRDRDPSHYLLSAVLCCVGIVDSFDYFACYTSIDIISWKEASLYPEGLIPLLWLGFTLTFARRFSFRLLPYLQQGMLLLALGVAVVPFVFPERAFYFSPDLLQERMVFLTSFGFFYYVAYLACLVNALVNLEVTFISATRTARWSIKFMVLGVSSLLAALILYYSQSVLYRTINLNLMPVRGVMLNLAVFLIVYSQVKRNEKIRIQVSRDIVYKSVVLFSIGLYLIGLGLMGEGMRYLGKYSQRSLVLALLFVITLGFMVVLLSETVQRRIRVFLIKNFFQDKYDYRSQWLQFMSRLSSAKTREELLTGILAGFCETFGMGCGILFLVDEVAHGFTPAASFEMKIPYLGVRMDDPLVSRMYATRWVINMMEENPEPGAEFGAFLSDNAILCAIPLFHNESELGFILIGRPLNRNEVYTFEDYDLMKTFAQQTSTSIMNLRLYDQLAQAKEMEVLGKISAFIVHDLKNLVYTLSLLNDNARNFIADPDFQHDMITSIGNTVAKMQGLIAKLKVFPDTGIRCLKPVDLLELLHQTAGIVQKNEVVIDGTSAVVIADPEEVQKVALNLIVNAIEATDGDRPIEINVGREGRRAYFRVSDRGCGIPAEFLRQDLFAPFRTTKKNGLGIGLYQCKSVIEALGGMIEVESTVGVGTQFCVWLPVADSVAVSK